MHLYAIHSVTVMAARTIANAATQRLRFALMASVQSVRRIATAIHQDLFASKANVKVLSSQNWTESGVIIMNMD